MVDYVYGNVDRIFVNTAIGCRAKCCYCYLPEIGIGGNNVEVIESKKIIDKIDKVGYYLTGESGSIISIGCYSECMSSECIKETMEIVKFFLNKGNYVQLSTKQKIPRIFFEEILEDKVSLGRLIVYVSMPIIEETKDFEKGTAAINIRCKNFEICSDYGVKAVLYIKPYIDGLTNKALEKFLEIINHYKIPVIVGDLLSTVSNGKTALIGQEQLHEIEVNKDEFVKSLEAITEVYGHSTDYIEFLRKKRK